MISGMTIGPLHWLENVDGNPHKIKTACGRFEWYSDRTELLDVNREAINPVTCPGCLEAMGWADEPVVVEVTR